MNGTVTAESKKRHSALDGRYSSKVTPDLRCAIHLLHEHGHSARAIARRADLHHATVARVLREPFDDVLARALYAVANDPDLADGPD